jgi:orotate phosphoribosyltransferase
MNQSDVLEFYKQKSALLEGHFELASKKHSSHYLQSALILQYPDLTHQLCEALAKKFQGRTIDVVAGPAIGGIIIAYELARILKVRAVYAERKEEKLELRRGFSIRKGERVLLVEDVITTGGSVMELADLCVLHGAEIAGCATLIDRSCGKHGIKYFFQSLVQADFPTYEREHCPLCQKGVSVVKPGSQKIAGKV